AVEPGLRDDRVAEVRALADLADPAGLAQRVGRVGLGLDVDRPDDVLAGAVAPVVPGEVVAADRRVVAVAERDRRLVAQPGMAVGREVPEMMMGVDDRQIVTQRLAACLCRAFRHSRLRLSAASPGFLFVASSIVYHFSPCQPPQPLDRHRHEATRRPRTTLWHRPPAPLSGGVRRGIQSLRRWRAHTRSRIIAMPWPT